MLTSSIGLKIIMAVTGVILSGFVLVHMAGNLQVFQGAEGARRLRQAAPRRARVALDLAGSCCSVRSAAHRAWLVLLTRKNQQARPVAYRQVIHQESSFASRSMRSTGPLLLAFIVYHILHLTTGTVHPGLPRGSRLPQPGHRV